MTSDCTGNEFDEKEDNIYAQKERNPCLARDGHGGEGICGEKGTERGYICPGGRARVMKQATHKCADLRASQMSSARIIALLGLWQLAQNLRSPPALFRVNSIVSPVMATSMAAALAASMPSTQAAPAPAQPMYEAIPPSMSKVIDIEAEIPITAVQLDALVCGLTSRSPQILF